MAEPDRDDGHHIILDFDEYAEVTNPVAPVPSEIGGETAPAVPRIVELQDLVKVGPDPSQCLGVEFSSCAIELRRGLEPPARHAPSSVQSSDAGRVCLSEDSQSRMTRSAQ